MKVDDSTVLLVTLQYHTEKSEDNHRIKDRSFYRWFAKAMSVEDWQKRIDYLLDDANRLEKYKIPNDTSGMFLSCKNNASEYPDVSNYAFGSWIERRFKKPLSWEDGQKQMQGFKKKTDKRPEGINANAVYETTGYVAENGDTVDLTSKESVLSHLNQNLVKPAGMAKKEKQTA